MNTTKNVFHKFADLIRKNINLKTAAILNVLAYALTTPTYLYK